MYYLGNIDVGIRTERGYICRNGQVLTTLQKFISYIHLVTLTHSLI